MEDDQGRGLIATDLARQSGVVQTINDKRTHYFPTEVFKGNAQN
jgi:hypothetical protein